MAALEIYFPEFLAGALKSAADRGASEIRDSLGALLSADALVYLAILSGTFVIDLLAMGYDRSAIRNLLRPDASTRSDIFIFLLDLIGIWRFVIAASFLLIGNYLGGWANTNIAFDWLKNLHAPVLQLLVFLVVSDFLDYWMHRTSHRISWWWEVHRLHHSATRFNLVTTIRHHPLDLALGDLFVAIPLAMLGTPIQDYFMIYLVKSVLGYLQHSMVPWRFGLLGRYILVSPVDHRIHHSPHPVHWDKHFGHFLIIWDRMFGTYYEGSFVNEKIGLSETEENRKGLTHDIVQGQLRFLRAFFVRRWSFREGVLARDEINRLEASHRSKHGAPAGPSVMSDRDSVAPTN